MVFPPGENGCHKLWNSSKSDALLYVDFDTTHVADVVFYPQSEKVGIVVNGTLHSCYKETDRTDYYHGES